MYVSRPITSGTYTISSGSDPLTFIVEELPDSSINRRFSRNLIIALREGFDSDARQILAMM